MKYLLLISIFIWINACVLAADDLDTSIAIQLMDPSGAYLDKPWEIELQHKRHLLAEVVTHRKLLDESLRGRIELSPKTGMIKAVFQCRFEKDMPGRRAQFSYNNEGDSVFDPYAIEPESGKLQFESGWISILEPSPITFTLPEFVSVSGKLQVAQADFTFTSSTVDLICGPNDEPKPKPNGTKLALGRYGYSIHNVLVEKDGSFEIEGVPPGPVRLFTESPKLVDIGNYKIHAGNADIDTGFLLVEPSVSASMELVWSHDGSPYHEDDFTVGEYMLKESGSTNIETRYTGWKEYDQFLGDGIYEINDITSGSYSLVLKGEGISNREVLLPRPSSDYMELGKVELQRKRYFALQLLTPVSRTLVDPEKFLEAKNPRLFESENFTLTQDRPDIDFFARRRDKVYWFNLDYRLANSVENLPAQAPESSFLIDFEESINFIVYKQGNNILGTWDVNQSEQTSELIVDLGKSQLPAMRNLVLRFTSNSGLILENAFVLGKHRSGHYFILSGFDNDEDARQISLSNVSGYYSSLYLRDHKHLPIELTLPSSAGDDWIIEDIDLRTGETAKINMDGDMSEMTFASIFIDYPDRPAPVIHGDNVREERILSSMFVGYYRVGDTVGSLGSIEMEALYPGPAKLKLFHPKYFEYHFAENWEMKPEEIPAPVVMDIVIEEGGENNFKIRIPDEWQR